MIVLLAMLYRGQQDWYKPITLEEEAPFFHRYLTEKEYRKRIDFSDVTMAGQDTLYNWTKEIWNIDYISILNVNLTDKSLYWALFWLYDISWFTAPFP